MMENKILVLKKLKTIPESTQIFELNGEEIVDKDTFLYKMEKLFHFPTSCKGSLDAYLDWMTDLSWLKSGPIVLIIWNAKKMLENNTKLKENVFQMFKEDILPFWEKEVEAVTVEGKCKRFDVFVYEDIDPLCVPRPWKC